MNRMNEGVFYQTVKMTEEPKQEIRKWEQKDADGVPTGKTYNNQQESIKGIIMKRDRAGRALPTELFYRTEMIADMVDKVLSWGDLFKDFIRNEEDLLSGKKLVKFALMSVPRENKTGDNAGIVTSFSTVIIGHQIIESDQEDQEFIESLKVQIGEQTVDEAFANLEALEADNMIA